MNENTTKAPNEEQIRSCLRCGKPVRIVQVDKYTDFCTEVMPKKWDAEHLTLVVYYEMHHPNCEPVSK